MRKKEEGGSLTLDIVSIISIISIDVKKQVRRVVNGYFYTMSLVFMQSDEYIQKRFREKKKLLPFRPRTFLSPTGLSSRLFA